MKRRKPAEPLDFTNPAAVEAWLSSMRGKLFEVRSLITEATMRKEERKLSRGYLRHRALRFVSDVYAALDRLSPEPHPTQCPPSEKPERGLP